MAAAVVAFLDFEWKVRDFVGDGGVDRVRGRRIDKERKRFKVWGAARGRLGEGGMGKVSGLMCVIGCLRRKGVVGVFGRWTNTEVYPRVVRSKSLMEGVAMWRKDAVAEGEAVRRRGEQGAGEPGWTWVAQTAMDVKNFD
jgi:hypothetical protein